MISLAKDKRDDRSITRFAQRQQFLRAENFRACEAADYQKQHG